VYPIRLIVVGRPKFETILLLEKHYEKLIKIFSRLEIIELKEGKGGGERQLQGEAARIRKAFSGFQRQVLLDANGEHKDSARFASWLGRCVDSGESLAFAVGSSNGFHASLKEDVKEHLSLSKMTFPHDLSRIMLLEQLYRAFCILHKKAYHK
jgi:23S rRNA (pseudouridine1915-N3)-methyltransferase